MLTPPKGPRYGQLRGVTRTYRPDTDIASLFEGLGANDRLIATPEIAAPTEIDRSPLYRAMRASLKSGQQGRADLVEQARKAARQQQDLHLLKAFGTVAAGLATGTDQTRGLSEDRRRAEEGRFQADQIAAQASAQNRDAAAQTGLALQTDKLQAAQERDRRQREHDQLQLAARRQALAQHQALQTANDDRAFANDKAAYDEHYTERQHARADRSLSIQEAGLQLRRRAAKAEADAAALQRGVLPGELGEGISFLARFAGVDPGKTLFGFRYGESDGYDASVQDYASARAFAPKVAERFSKALSELAEDNPALYAQLGPQMQEVRQALYDASNDELAFEDVAGRINALFADEQAAATSQPTGPTFEDVVALADGVGGEAQEFAAIPDAELDRYFAPDTAILDAYGMAGDFAPDDISTARTDDGGFSVRVIDGGQPRTFLLDTATEALELSRRLRTAASR